MNKLISCNLMGGLGNQMFQTSHALAQGMKHNREVIFIPKSWIPMQGRDTFNYKDNVFRHLTFVENIDGFVKVHEGPWEFSEINPVEENTVFDGYFQSGKNFLGYDDRIREMFGPTQEFIDLMKNKYPQLNQDNTVSVHVRLGDYKQNPHIHPSVSKEYIQTALNLCGDYSHLFLFGDDKNWLNENFGGDNVTIIDEEDYMDLWIMSLCKMNILSNSTFSWWGAFLNKNIDRKVFIPSVWFGPSGPQNYKDMYQPEWTKIEVEYINGELKPKKINMSEKVKIRKVSDRWGDYDCSSARNNPKLLQWLSRDTQDPHEFTIYVDNYIKDWGFSDPSREKMGWLLESPQINEGTIKYLLDNLEMVKEHYKYIFTCMDSLIALGAPFVYTISNAVPWIWENNRKIHEKTKLVSMIASNKGWLRGHQNRLNWVEKLKDQVDLFGSGRPNQLKDKEDGLVDYMFSVAIENDDSDTYFTEKLTDCFAVGTVPVYWGSRKVVEKYFDPRGVIFLEDDPELKSLSKEKYESMLPFIQKNFETALSLPIAEDYIFENYLK